MGHRMFTTAAFAYLITLLSVSYNLIGAVLINCCRDNRGVFKSLLTHSHESTKNIIFPITFLIDDLLRVQNKLHG